MKKGLIFITILLSVCTTFATENEITPTESDSSATKDTVETQQVEKTTQEESNTTVETSKVDETNETNELKNVFAVGASFGIPEIVGLKLEYSPKIRNNTIGFLLSGGFFPMSDDDGNSSMVSNIDVAARIYSQQSIKGAFIETGYNLMMLGITDSDDNESGSNLHLIRLAGGYKFEKSNFFVAPAAGYNIFHIAKDSSVDGFYLYLNLSVGGTFSL